MNKLKMILAMLFMALAFSACSSGNDNTVAPVPSLMRDYRFDYYYTQECIYDNAGFYRCERSPWAISPALTIVLSIASDDYVEVSYECHIYPFNPGSYEYAWDSYTRRNYYLFLLGGGLQLTIYDDASEAVFTDEIAGVETHYFYSR